MLNRSLIVSFAVVACCGGTTAVSSAPKAEADVVTAYVHGKALNADSMPVKVTPAVVLKSQAAIIQNLKSSVGQAQKDGVARLQATASAAPASAEGDRVWANALTIATLTQDIESDVATSARELNFSLLAQYGELTKKPVKIEDIENGAAPAFTTQSLKGMTPGSNMGKLFGMDRVKRNIKTYGAKCRNAGVPIPPAFGDPAWTIVGDIDPAQSFLFPKGQATPTQKETIYSYSTPNGLCVAFTANITDPANWVVIDLVCQGVSNGPDKTVSNSKACYWQAPGPLPVLAQGQTYPLDGGRFKSPPDLAAFSMCSDCHAGENAFANQAGTAMDKAVNDFNAKYANNFLTRNTWHTDIVDPTWAQNIEPGPYPTGNGLCGGCHTADKPGGRLPNVAQGLVYDPAPATTVTGGVKAGYPTRDSLYKYCNYELPNNLTADTANGAAAGPMAPYAGVPDTERIFNACKTLYPNSPATRDQWIAKHGGVPKE